MNKIVKIVLSKEGEINYNASDATGFERGYMGRGKPKVKRIYSVFKIEKGLAYCQSLNGWGVYCDEVFPVNTLEPYEKKSYEKKS